MTLHWTWAVTALSLLAVVLNIRRQRACFLIWCGTNAAWTVVDLQHGLHAQAALQSCYLGLSIWGLCAWRTGAEKR